MSNCEKWEIIGFSVNFIILLGFIIRNHARIEHRITVLETYLKIVLKDNGHKIEE